MEKPVPAMSKLSELIEMSSTLRQQGLFSCTVLGLHCIKVGHQGYRSNAADARRPKIIDISLTHVTRLHAPRRASIQQHLENHRRDDMLKTIVNLLAVLKAIRCSVTLTTALQHLHESVHARAGAGSVNLSLERFENALARELHHEALYIAEPRRR